MNGLAHLAAAEGQPAQLPPEGQAGASDFFAPPLLYPSAYHPPPLRAKPLVDSF